MSELKFSRRLFMQAAITATLGSKASHNMIASENRVHVPLRVITKGPRHHWFGYYDKLQFDPTSRFILGMEVSFEHRSPTTEDTIKVGMIDLDNNDRWIELGESNSWSWQQGCMLQWVPGSRSKVLWNDLESDRYVCRILDINTSECHTVPHAIYSVNPDGKSAITTDFSRIQNVRAGYGYPGIQDQHADELAPEKSGIFHIDLETGKSQLILSLAKIAETGNIPNKAPGIKHYFNHLLFSPDGSRFIALHRWRYPNGRRLTRLITAKPDGSDLRIVIDNGYASHFIWKDPGHILAQSKIDKGLNKWGIFLFEDKEHGSVEEVGEGILDGSGHLSYLPGNEWILNDTYPKGKERLQTPHLYHIRTKRRFDIASINSPKAYTGEWRCDTHPRFSPDSNYVCFDSPYKSTGRQLYLADIRELINA